MVNTWNLNIILQKLSMIFTYHTKIKNPGNFLPGFEYL